MSDDQAIRYRFGPLERRGLIAGWRSGQIACVSVGLLAAVVVLRRQPSVAGVAGALALVGLSVALATWPVAGRSVEEWAPDAVRHASGALGRRPRRGERSPFSTLQVLVVEGGDDRTVAVVFDRATRSYTAVLAVRGSGFVLLGTSDKVDRVSSWSGVLASLCRQGTAVHRLQWVARSRPDDGAGLRRHLAGAATLDDAAPARRSYDALLESVAEGTRTYEVFVALTVDARRAARAIRTAGSGHAGACRILLREATWLRRQLADAGLSAGELLDRGQLAEAVRAGFERATAASGPRHAALPWPMDLEAFWSKSRVDGTWHTTYWVAEWPRRDVGPEFLGPLVISDVRRTLSLVMEPVAAVEAARRIEKARTDDIADNELRRRGGFLDSARRRRQQEVLSQREHELADGHAQFRFSAYVTVTADEPDALEDACVRTEQSAGRAGLDLRRCYGDQGRAFTSTLPLGRGLA